MSRAQLATVALGAVIACALAIYGVVRMAAGADERDQVVELRLDKLRDASRKMAGGQRIDAAEGELIRIMCKASEQYPELAQPCMDVIARLPPRP